MGRDVHLLARLHRLGVLTAVITFAAALAVVVGTNRAGAAATTVVLGAAAPATPACPGEPCQAIGKTTGFQSTIGKTKDVFAAPYPGRVVAWSIKLSAPTTTGNEPQKAFFDKFFGGGPSARLSILKPNKKAVDSGTPLYKLKSQSPVEDLEPYLGTTTTFTLQAPLKVNTGQIVALTVPTWAPAFAVGLPEDTAWRASRKKGKCSAAADIQAGSPHTKLGQDRTYGCLYKTARVLYSATLVKDPNAPAPKPPSKKKPQEEPQN